MVVNQRTGHGPSTRVHRKGGPYCLTLKTRLRVRLWPQSVSKRYIDRSTMPGFPIPYGMTLKIGGGSLLAFTPMQSN
jgi:hypothetical protein